MSEYIGKGLGVKLSTSWSHELISSLLITFFKKIFLFEGFYIDNVKYCISISYNFQIDERS